MTEWQNEALEMGTPLRIVTGINSGKTGIVEALLYCVSQRARELNEAGQLLDSLDDEEIADQVVPVYGLEPSEYRKHCRRSAEWGDLAFQLADDMGGQELLDIVTWEV